MLKFYLLSDNVDTQVGMRLVGIEGVVLHTKESLIESLTKVMQDETIGVVLITTKLVELAPRLISELKLRQSKPLIVEIPDRHGSSHVGDAIDTYVFEAIGMKMKGD